MMSGATCKKRRDGSFFVARIREKFATEKTLNKSPFFTFDAYLFSLSRFFQAFLFLYFPHCFCFFLRIRHDSLPMDGICWLPSNSCCYVFKKKLLCVPLFAWISRSLLIPFAPLEVSQLRFERDVFFLFFWNKGAISLHRQVSFGFVPFVLLCFFSLYDSHNSRLYFYSTLVIWRIFSNSNK
jgi:hypothetical protein